MADDIVRLAQEFKDALEALDEAALERIVLAYQRIYKTLEGRIDALVMEIAVLDSPTKSQILKLARYKELSKQTIEEITRFQSYLRTEIINAAQLSYNLTEEQSTALIEAVLAQAGITAQLGNLPADSFEAIVGFLQEGSPLYNRIDLLAGSTADYVREKLLEAVALGYSPRKTARIIENAFGRGLTDALRMARTAQLYASRAAALANYQASGVVDGWVWFATLDDTVCQSCIVQHGTIHPLTEILNDHHNGRCAMLPYIEEFGNQIEQSGIEWLEAQPEAKQREILGAGKYEAWKAGKFNLAQLSKEHDDEVYGKMRVEVPLKELVK